jgi:hypothetical protein
MVAVVVEFYFLFVLDYGSRDQRPSDGTSRRSRRRRNGARTRGWLRAVAAVNCLVCARREYKSCVTRKTCTRVYYTARAAVLLCSSRALAGHCGGVSDSDGRPEARADVRKTSGGRPTTGAMIHMSAAQAAAVLVVLQRAATSRAQGGILRCAEEVYADTNRSSGIWKELRRWLDDTTVAALDAKVREWQEAQGAGPQRVTHPQQLQEAARSRADSWLHQLRKARRARRREAESEAGDGPSAAPGSPAHRAAATGKPRSHLHQTQVGVLLQIAADERDVRLEAEEGETVREWHPPTTSEGDRRSLAAVIPARARPYEPV